MTEKREHRMIELEITNCENNIEFYQIQIDNMEEKLLELKRLKKAHEFY